MENTNEMRVKAQFAGLLFSAIWVKCVHEDGQFHYKPSGWLEMRPGHKMEDSDGFRRIEITLS